MLKIKTPAIGVIVVEKDDRRFRLFCLVGLILMVLNGIVQFYRHPLGLGSEQVEGSIAGACLFAAIWIIFFEQIRFVFDRPMGMLKWERRRVWKLRRGEVPFTSILRVRAEIPLGDEGIPSRRIVLDLSDGNLLPLTVAYTPDHGDIQLNLAERLRELIFGDTASGPDDEIRAAIETGRIIEAIKQLRTHDGLSLTEARARILEMQKQKNSSQTKT